MWLSCGKVRGFLHLAQPLLSCAALEGDLEEDVFDEVQTAAAAEEVSGAYSGVLFFFFTLKQCTLCIVTDVQTPVPLRKSASPECDVHKDHPGILSKCCL